MCGFIGIVNLKKVINHNELEKKLNKAHIFLRPRGPDERGVWYDKNTYFLHTRLKILDLKDTSSQPMEFGEFVISYNGEIYNFKELKEILLKNGFTFKSSGDTEILLASWKFWGEDVLQKLDGMFAFSIWDKINKVLYLAKDRFGKKPLVYTHTENSIAFSSDIRSLKEISYEGDIDELAVESLFRYRFIHEPLTIYKNFKKLPAGSFLKFSKRGLELKKWFKINNKTSNYDQAERSKKIVELTTNAVEKRLISDVPVGIFLSGGIDSGVISACLAELGEKIPHFTVGFNDEKDDYYNEMKTAEKITKYFGFEHHKLYLKAEKINPLIEDIIATSDEPFADSSAIPTFMIAKETSQHMKVALSGDGGDEVFGGYRKYIAYRWKFLAGILPNFLKAYLNDTKLGFKNNNFSEIMRKVKRFFFHINTNINEMQMSFLDQLSDFEHNELFGKKKGDSEKEVFNDLDIFDDALNQALARDIIFSLSGDMLVKVDRFSMRHSLEIRSPFLDKDLVDYAFSIEGKKKIGYFNGKKVLKKAFQQMLPKNYMSLPKKGFEIPLEKWLMKDLKYLLDKVSKPEVLESLNIKNKTLVDNWKNDFIHGKSDNSWKLWTLINFTKWAELNKYI